MFEYLKTKQADTPKHGISHAVVQQKVIQDRNSYADRYTKLGYCPVREMGSVVQMCCEESSEEPEDPRDSLYGEPKKSRPSNSRKLRSNLGEKGNGGEAHHLIPINVAWELSFVNDENIEEFNDDWNGIMLHGTIDKEFEVQNEYTGEQGAPDILHRVNGERSHNYYDNIVRDIIREKNPKNIRDCHIIADELRKLILNSKQAYALDFLPNDGS